MPYPIPYVAIIDVGHGNSTVMRDGSEAIIVDCGARGSALLEFLTKEEIAYIDSIFLSHADQDHIAGLLALISSSKFNINTIYVNSDASKRSDLWEDMSYELSQLNEIGQVKFIVGITRSKRLYKCGSINLIVVGPSPYLAAKGAGGLDHQDREITSNSLSASFHISWNEEVIAYLAGDIDQIGLDDLVAHKAHLNAPILVFPHHGGKSDNFDIVAFTKQLCELTNATTVIFSIGRNKHDNPRPEVVATVRGTLPGVRVSCTELSKNCAKHLPTTSSPHLLELFSRGKEKNECCSGTFIIKLGDTIEYFPDLKSHREFISSSAPTSLCI